jgi:hypothetical protein
MKAKFEENHFYFDPANTICRVGEDGIKQYKLDHAMVSLNAWQLPGKDGKPELFVKNWLDDPMRRNVDRLVYKMPADCAANEASLFRGFGFEKHKGDYTPAETAGAIEEFQRWTHYLAGGEQIVQNYLINFIAHMIQRPFDVPGICIIFSSLIQGIGKDNYMQVISDLIGTHHTAHYIDDSQFWSPYDEQQEGAIVMYLEEAGAAANKVKANALKARITSSTITINPKGRMAYTIPNIARYFMTTNEVNPVKLEESDRRFLLINPIPGIVPTNMPATERFNTWASLKAKMASPAWLWTIGSWLASLDIRVFNPREFPVTSVKETLAELSEKSELQFLKIWKPTKEWNTATDVYNDYRSWCLEHSMPACSSARAFSVAITPYEGQHIQRRMLDGLRLIKKIGDA